MNPPAPTIGTRRSMPGPVTAAAACVCLLLLAGLAVPSSPAAEGKAGAEAARDLAVEHNNLAIALLAQFKPADAEKELRKALEAVPDYVPAFVNVGIAQLAQVRYDEAVESFRRALLIDPNNIWAHYNLSLIFKIQGNAGEGIKHALSAVNGNPRDADLHYNLGSLHQAAREFDKAIEEFQTAIRLDVNVLPAYYAVGRAYIAKGDMEQGRKYIKQHQALTAASNLPSSSSGLRYGEQGRYSFAMEDSSMRSVEALPLPAGKVTFTDASAESGLLFTHAGPGNARLLRGPLPTGGDVPALIRKRVAALMSGGVALADLNGDGSEEIVLVNTAGKPSGLFVNKGKMKFERSSASAAIPPGDLMGIAAGDVDNDGDIDLLVTRYGGASLLLNDGKGALQPSELPPFPAGYLASGAALADMDHDGDLDLFISGFVAPPNPHEDPIAFPGGFGGSQLRLLRNNGNGTFADATSEAKFDVGPRRSIGAVFSDFDNDRDIDVAVARLGGGIVLFSNNRDGTFSERGVEAGLPGKGNFLGLCVGDYNRDGWMDLLATSWDHSLPRLFSNTGSGRFALDVAAFSRVPRGGEGPSFGCAFADLDNDGLVDILAVNGTDKGGAVQYLRNLGPDGFEDSSGSVGLSSIPARNGRGLAVGDLDGDGDLDLLLSNNGASPSLLRNDGGNTNHWVAVSAKGLNSNRGGIGTKVEVKVGLLWQKTEIISGSGYLSSSSPDPLFGLGRYSRVDALRLLWPGGVLQDEVQLASDKKHTVEELDRKGTSCPILYAWNGEKVAFITDLLGGSAFGYLLAPGRFNSPDTNEYIRIPPGGLLARDGMYEIYMNNQLEEAIYFDRSRLIAVDHPGGTEVYPDERLMPGPPYPPFKIHVVSGTRPPVAARDDDGNDVLDLLSKVDRRYVGGFDHLPFKGYAESHSVTLDLGPDAAGGALLVLTGWIDYADSTSNLAASQAGAKLVTPYLESLDPASGEWEKIIPEMGFPAGLPKPMTVDLRDRLPRGARKIRITTSMRIYWDQILVAKPAAAASATIRRLSPAGAVLRFRGFPLSMKASSLEPTRYDYERDEPYVAWKAHTGAYTRFGDVRDLLMEEDDRYVITRAGDEIKLSFDAGDLPPIPAGRTRTFLVYADGFGKDMDLNSARPHHVGPLPHHLMTSFPYPPSNVYPLDEARAEYLNTYNTRTVFRNVPPLMTDPGSAGSE
jgi:Tfp pilus assembly protein PilF